VPYELSRDFLIALKFSDKPQYRIAQLARLNPSVLSKIVTGAERILPNDRRVLAVAKVLGFPPEQCLVQRDVDVEAREVAP
jgi:hypothetical protein